MTGALWICSGCAKNSGQNFLSWQTPSSLLKSHRRLICGRAGAQLARLPTKKCDPRRPWVQTCWDSGQLRARAGGTGRRPGVTGPRPQSAAPSFAHLVAFVGVGRLPREAAAAGATAAAAAAAALAARGSSQICGGTSLLRCDLCRAGLGPTGAGGDSCCKSRTSGWQWDVSLQRPPRS